MSEVALPMRERVEALERSLLAQQPVDCPIRHHFAPGVYAREMTVPAGTVLTGAVHKTCHLSILSKGRVQVTSDEGVIEMVAPCTLLASKGTKRAIHALEDSVWTTVHATPTTDLDALVEELTESTADELQGGARNPQQLAYEERMRLES
jgi:hypothetical protein